MTDVCVLCADISDITYTDSQYCYVTPHESKKDGWQSVPTDVIFILNYKKIYKDMHLIEKQCICGVDFHHWNLFRQFWRL